MTLSKLSIAVTCSLKEAPEMENSEARAASRGGYVVAVWLQSATNEPAPGRPSIPTSTSSVGGIHTSLVRPHSVCRSLQMATSGLLASATLCRRLFRDARLALQRADSRRQALIDRPDDLERLCQLIRGLGNRSSVLRSQFCHFRVAASPGNLVK